MAVDDGGRSPATLRCPACGGNPFPDPRRLAVHLERHREVQAAVVDHGTGRELSHRCPADCGRHFQTLVEFREHAPVCDGKPPLPPLDGRMIASVAGEAGYRPLVCPECRVRIDEPERLGVHIERHREVMAPIRGKMGEVVSKPCPKGCGRHFPPKGAYDFRRHVQLCEGEKPIPAWSHDGRELKPVGNVFRKREDGMYTCRECGRSFQRPNTIAIHMKAKHPGSSAGPYHDEGTPERAEAADTDAVRADDVEIVSRLKDKAEEHLKKAEKIEELMKDLQPLL